MLPSLPLRALTRLRFGRRVRLPIAAVLVGGFGSLTLVAVASVLALGLTIASQNTYALLNDKSDLVLRGLEQRVRNQLDPARAIAVFLAGAVESGTIDVADRHSLVDTMRGTLAAVPNVSGVAWLDADDTGVRVSRTDGKLTVAPVTLSDAAKSRAAAATPPETLAKSGPEWLAPLWSEELHASFLAVQQPVRRDGRYAGMVIVGVTLGDLSRFLSTLYVEQGINAFVLYDRSHVLAHPVLAARQFDLSGRTAGPPLPRLEEVDDPVLAGLWERGMPIGGFRFRIEGLRLPVAGEDHLVLLRRMAGYGGQEWTLGVSFREGEVDQELRRLGLTAAAGGVILLLSVAAALFVGRRISRQVGQLADAADRVRSFDFSDVRELPDSRLRELARAAAAFNSMVAGLRWFETYVPKALVLRLMRRRGAGSVFASEERQVTVMFTDIRGFSRLAEHLGAIDTAALLNEHFTTLAACIEAEGGTVDKFIGDAIMAFWGAPEEQADHAARALRAAHAIAAAIRADNRRRAAAGLDPVRVRIGLHSGSVVVGNIGSASRINYTIVGDAVNVASRIEELASGLQGEAEVIVLASGVTAAMADGAVSMTALGEKRLRGRNGTCAVWRMETEPRPSAPPYIAPPPEVYGDESRTASPPDPAA